MTKTTGGTANNIRRGHSGGFELNSADDTRIGEYIFLDDGYDIVAKASGYYHSNVQNAKVPLYKSIVDNVNFVLQEAIVTAFSFNNVTDLSKDVVVNFKAYNRDGTPYTGKVSALLNGYNITVTGATSASSNFMTLASSAVGEYTLTFNLQRMGIGSVDNAVLMIDLDDVTDMSPLVFGEVITEDNLTLKATPSYVNAGEEFTLNAAFSSKVDSNTAVLTFNYDPDVFECSDAEGSNFIAAEGVSLISETIVAPGTVKVVVAVLGGYGMTDVGGLKLKAKDTAEFDGSLKTFSVNAQYVLNTVPKTIASGAAYTTVKGNVEILPGAFNLIDLSDIIDWFGTDDTNPDWFLKYADWDFNNDGKIDIWDITFVATNIVI